MDIALVLIISLLIIPAIMATIFCWWASRSGLTKRQVKYVGFLCFIPGLGWLLAWVYIICTEYGFSINFWVGGMLIAAFILPIIGPIVWLYLLYRLAREERRALVEGAEVTAIDPETGIHIRQYIPPSEPQDKRTPPSEWR